MCSSDLAGGTSSYTSPSSGEVDPSAGETPGYSAVAFEIVDPGTVSALKKSMKPFNQELILTYTKAYGTTLGGDHVESNTFQFPIQVCRGCLIQWLNGPGAPTPNCLPNPALTTAPMEPSLCYVGQDVGGVLCTACEGEDPFCLCPSVTSTATPTARECAAFPVCCPTAP